MTTRLRPAGFDARPERPSSLRAQAQRVYRKKSEAAASAAAPTPDRGFPSRAARDGGGEQQAGGVDGEQAALAADEARDRGEEQVTELTRQVRALYEAGVVPVAEIARLAGVAERTLYRYVEKGGWRRRYATHAIAAAVAKRAAKRRPRPCVTRKGAGGRFIRDEDVGKPVRRGLKALDAAGEARALARTERAALLSEEAVARTARLREAISDLRIMANMAGVARDLAAVEDGEQEPKPLPKEKPRRRPRKPWRPMPGSGW
jgi:helix-turn-helix resolvase-like protein